MNNYFVIRYLHKSKIITNKLQCLEIIITISKFMKNILNKNDNREYSVT